jgi:hypothetical protein
MFCAAPALIRADRRLFRTRRRIRQRATARCRDLFSRVAACRRRHAPAADADATLRVALRASSRNAAHSLALPALRLRLAALFLAAALMRCLIDAIDAAAITLSCCRRRCHYFIADIIFFFIIFAISFSTLFIFFIFFAVSPLFYR